MTTFVVIATLLAGGELGFLLAMHLYQKRIATLVEQRDAAMKGWSDAIEILQGVQKKMDEFGQAIGAVPLKDGSVVSPIQIKKQN